MTVALQTSKRRAHKRRYMECRGNDQERMLAPKTVNERGELSSVSCVWTETYKPAAAAHSRVRIERELTTYKPLLAWDGFIGRG
jgi:hypothetical protein